MKTTLYMAMSIDGFIAQKDNTAPWSQEEFESFFAMVKQVGNLVIGRKTFEIMKENDELRNLDGVMVLVVGNTYYDDVDNVYVVDAPERALSLLEEHGFSQALVGGGATLNTSFFEKNFVDELYVDIEPVVFGDGVRFLNKALSTKKFKLIETKLLTRDIIQLHYKLINN